MTRLIQSHINLSVSGLTPLGMQHYFENIGSVLLEEQDSKHSQIRLLFAIKYPSVHPNPAKTVRLGICHMPLDTL